MRMTEETSRNHEEILHKTSTILLLFEESANYRVQVLHNYVFLLAWFFGNMSNTEKLFKFYKKNYIV